MLHRRMFLRGLVAAPAVVAAGSVVVANELGSVAKSNQRARKKSGALLATIILGGLLLVFLAMN